jgi:hypothetical protein
MITDAIKSPKSNKFLRKRSGPLKKLIPPLESRILISLEKVHLRENLTKRRGSVLANKCLNFKAQKVSMASDNEEPMMEDSEGYDYGDGSDYGGSDDGMGGYDYGDAGGSSPIAHLRKVI